MIHSYYAVEVYPALNWSLIKEVWPTFFIIDSTTTLSSSLFLPHPPPPPPTTDKKVQLKSEDDFAGLKDGDHVRIITDGEEAERFGHDLSRIPNQDITGRGWGNFFLE